jgi:hypothetical protein
MAKKVMTKWKENKNSKKKEIKIYIKTFFIIKLVRKKREKKFDVVPIALILVIRMMH